MTVQLIQTAQVSIPSDVQQQLTNTFISPYPYSIVINPTLPVIVFSVETSCTLVFVSSDPPSSTLETVSSDPPPSTWELVIVEQSSITIIPPSNNGAYIAIQAYHNPILFFENAILMLIDNLFGYAPSDQNPLQADILTYNIVTQSFSGIQNFFASNSFFSQYTCGWGDAYIDYSHQVLYLLVFYGYLFIMLLFAIPFSELSSLLTNYQLPQNFYEATIMPPNGENLLPFVCSVNPNVSSSNLLPSRLIPLPSYPATPVIVYFSGTFYIVFMDVNTNADIWVFSLSDLTFTTSTPSTSQTIIGGSEYSNVPSNLQVVGTVMTIFNTQNISLYLNATFNYYMSNGNIYPEILVNIYWNPYSSFYTYNYTILSVDPSTLSVNTIASLTYNNAITGHTVYWNIVTYVNNPLIMTGAILDGEYLGIFIYNRNTGETQFLSAPYNATNILVTDGGYVIILYNNYLYVYQIVSDYAPVLTNVQFNQNNTITGTAMDLVSNTPASGVVVALFQLESQGGYNFSGEIIATTTTDSNGNFSFQVSQPGYYAIRAFT